MQLKRRTLTDGDIAREISVLNAFSEPYDYTVAHSRNTSHEKTRRCSCRATAAAATDLCDVRPEFILGM